MEGASEKIIYSQLLSSVNPSFWSKLTDLKLDVDKLIENDRYIWGYSHLLPMANVPFSVLEVDSTSFNEKFNSQNMYLPFEGKILNKNTIEQFKNCNKMELINNEGADLYENIKNGKILDRPSRLNKFFILSFADLKKYIYYYWFAYLVPSNLVLEYQNKFLISETSNIEALDDLYSQFKSLDDFQKPYFIVEQKQEGYFQIYELKKMKELDSETVKNYYFSFYNTTVDTTQLRSQLRNYVILILHYCSFLKGKVVKFLSFNLKRENSKITCRHSEGYNIKLPESIEEHTNSWVGWEKNEREKMGPRMANMKSTLDPKILAESAIDLNLKLMKWRIQPNIDLDAIKKTKCLVLGSGTLGCAVGRNLLAWGVRDITFVDNSTVSFSNPVRQSLFTYEDSVAMKCKALAAADALKKVFPGVNSKGYKLNIPMPGHSVGDTMLQQTKENVNALTDLIKEHDIIFLLMDSRESRWLPTILCSFFDKIVINAALGFDSYLVMRHGAKTRNHNVSDSKIVDGYKVVVGSNLGCYFCNDVTAPGDSTHDRTLDQQCTVTRPGVSQIAGALATELAVSLLQHPDRSEAAAFYKMTNDSTNMGPEMENQCILGLIPHSIRGFLSSFSQILPATMKYNQCIACSDYVLQEYEKDGFEFLLKVFNTSKYLEDVTHLTEMFSQLDTEFGDVLDYSDDEFD